MLFDFKADLTAEMKMKMEAAIGVAVKAAIGMAAVVNVEAKLEATAGATGKGKMDAKLKMIVKAGASVKPSAVEIKLNAAVRTDKKLELLKVVKTQIVKVDGMWLLSEKIQYALFLGKNPQNSQKFPKIPPKSLKILKKIPTNKQNSALRGKIPLKILKTI